MSSHTLHEGLPTYNPAALFHDGCDECEQRTKDPNFAILMMDSERFRRAWDRAIAWQTDRLVDHINECEAPVLLALWSMYLQAQRGHLTVEMVAEAARG